MTEVIRISDQIFLVKEIIDEKTFVIISHNMENSTRDFLTEKDWKEASEKFPIENLESIPELLNAVKYINHEESEKEQEMANWDINNFHIFSQKR